MDDNVTVPRTTVEAFIRVAKNVLEDTNSGSPDRLERAEVTVVNNERSKLKEAVYQAERSLYEADVSQNAITEKNRQTKGNLIHTDFSEDKMNFIEGRRR